MTFFARPNLSNEQFKQLVGSTLTLSGQTRIATTTGLTLYNNSIGTSYPNITITAENADSHIGDILTYDGTGKIKLLPAGAGGDPYYNSPYKSPAAVSLCGISAGYVLTGKTLSCIIETLLVPTLNPTLTAPSNTLSISPSTTTYEVGASVTITANATFNRGCINPQYSSACDKRSGLPSSYNYIAFSVVCPAQISSSLSNSYALSPYSIINGNNQISGTVSYNAGVQPKDSSGGNYSTPLPAGTTSAQCVVICGLYPYFYGKVASGGAPAGLNRPIATNALVTGGTKVVAISTNTITVTFNSTADDYIWFAIPNASTSKTCWYIDATNKGVIGGGVSPGCNLFPINNSVSVTTVCWAGQTYKVYISNYQTCSTLPMELRNS